jgi:hypothetical protein
MSNSLSSLRLRHPFRPYYYGSHKWEDYLVDIQEAISAIAHQQDQGLQQALIGGIEELRAEFEWGLALTCGPILAGVPRNYLHASEVPCPAWPETGSISETQESL